MAVESRSRLLNTLGERETFIQRGFDFQEAELAAARAKLSEKAREGNKAAAQHLSEIKDQQRRCPSAVTGHWQSCGANRN